MTMGQNQRKHLDDVTERARRAKERKRTLATGTDLGGGGGDSLPEATNQYQVIRANEQLEWIADWVRAH